MLSSSWRDIFYHHALRGHCAHCLLIQTIYGDLKRHCRSCAKKLSSEELEEEGGRNEAKVVDMDLDIDFEHQNQLTPSRPQRGCIREQMQSGQGVRKKRARHFSETSQGEDSNDNSDERVHQG